MDAIVGIVDVAVMLASSSGGADVHDSRCRIG